MGGSSPRQVQTQEQTATTRLPANQQANVDLLMQGARDFYLSGGPRYFPGQTFAGPTQSELLSQGMMRDYAGGTGSAFANQVVSGDQFWLNPENIFRPENIPGFRASQQAITDLTTRNLTEQILPSIRSGSVAQGALGGSRQEIGEGLAVEGTSRGIADALAQMELGAYGQGLNMYNAAAARAPQTFAVGAAPAGLLEYSGGVERANEQQAIDAAMARFNFEELAPLLNLEALQALTGTAGQYGGTVESWMEGITKQKGGGGALTQGLGLALMAASLFG